MQFSSAFQAQSALAHRRSQLLSRGRLEAGIRAGLGALADRRREAMEASRAPDAERLSNLRSVIHATDALFRLADGLSAFVDVDRALRDAGPEIRESIQTIVDMSDTGIDGDILADGLIGKLDRVRGATREDLDDVAGRFVAFGTSLSVARVRRRMWRMHVRRVRALHEWVLEHLVRQEGKPVAYPEGLVGEIGQRAMELRAAGHRLARAARGGRVGLAEQLGAVSSIKVWEQWLLSTAPTIAGAFPSAGSDVSTSSIAAARSAAHVYDRVRVGLSLDASLRQILLDVAVRDAASIQALGSSADLPMGTATLDLPRSDLSDVVSAEEGATMEVGGLVVDAEYVAGGPSPRSVLTLNDGTGVAVVLVPFASVDSFGVVPGVWLQARGSAFPGGKDDVGGPVIQVRRWQLQKASTCSFLDKLLSFSDRAFSYRPGGYDILAARVAGRQALNEVRMRAEVDHDQL